MIKKGCVTVAILLTLLVFVLLIPFVLKDRTARYLIGPDLSEIEYSEIFFRNGDLKLSGMLFIPEGEGPFPVAVIIHGSGPSYRNNPWYLSVSKHLKDSGIVVLLPDKRGSEKSEGDWRISNFEDLAGDTISAIESIKDQHQFVVSYIGVIGMSQGGWIAPLVATKSDNVFFVVSMSGAAVTTEEQLLHEEFNNIVQMGTYRMVAKIIAPFTTTIIRNREFWSYIGEFDPIPYWQEVSVPAFAAFGENDSNVPVEESVLRLAEVDRKITVKVYPSGGHTITDPVTGMVQSLFLNDLAGFIKNAS